jgi:hypothetical protein
MLHDTYTTAADANLFVRIFNLTNGQGRLMYVEPISAGVYEVWERL